MSSSHIFIGETIGTAVLILLGVGVCAAVTLKGSKAKDAGWLVVSFGWGFAVLTGAYLASGVSGAHLNPAVTIGLAIEGGTSWSDVPLYLGSQLLGAMIGAALVWVAYYGHFQAHLKDEAVIAEAAAAPKDAPGPVLGVFSTTAQIRNTVQNLGTEIIATTVLVLAILTQGSTTRATASASSARSSPRWSWSASACRSVAPRGTRSTRSATSAPAWCTRRCRCRTRAAPPGSMPGFRWPDR